MEDELCLTTSSGCGPTSPRSVGRPTSGGYFRQPFTPPERELRAWFVEQCEARGLRVETDGFGNVVGWWDAGSGPGVLTGSHLDSVLDGGAYDGPLGVVSALAAIDLLRERGVVPARPIGVSVFVEEEGSRFGLACLGSRLATGAIVVGARRGSCGTGTAWRFERRRARAARPAAAGRRSGRFVELHVEQGRDLVDRGAAVGVASEIWPHGRYRFDFTGEANHAGTTRMEDRHDPMLTYAMTALAANKQARLAGQRATFGRVDGRRPTAPTRCRRGCTAWLDARCATDDGARPSWSTTIARQATERAGRDGTALTVTAGVGLGRGRLRPGAGRAGSPPTTRAATGRSSRPQAGHDAGILSAAGIPTAMLFVRNPTGVSHSPGRARRDRRLPGRRRTRWPTPSSGWPREHGVPAGAGVGRRRRPRRRAGRDRGRAVHPVALETPGSDDVRRRASFTG